MAACAGPAYASLPVPLLTALQPAACAPHAAPLPLTVTQPLTPIVCPMYPRSPAPTPAPIFALQVLRALRPPLTADLAAGLVLSLEACFLAGQPAGREVAVEVIATTRASAALSCQTHLGSARQRCDVPSM